MNQASTLLNKPLHWLRFRHVVVSGLNTGPKKDTDTGFRQSRSCFTRTSELASKIYYYTEASVLVDTAGTQPRSMCRNWRGIAVESRKIPKSLLHMWSPGLDLALLSDLLDNKLPDGIRKSIASPKMAVYQA